MYYKVLDRHYQYATGGYTDTDGWRTKTSKNKPKQSTVELYNMLKFRVRRKCDLKKAMIKVNGRTDVTYSGYNDSTIAWHVNAGRLFVDQTKGKTMVGLTPKGWTYAVERGIYKV